MRTRIISSLVVCFLVLGITSLGFSQKSMKSTRVDKSTYVGQYDDNKIVPYTGKYSNFSLTLDPGFRSGDYVIGPEINTGVTGWYDYMTNGDCRHYIWLDPTNSSIINVIYTTSDSSDPAGATTRRTVYAYSTDGGTTWSPQFNVPNARSGFGCLALTSDGRAVIANHQSHGGATTSSLYVDAFPQLESFAEYFAPSVATPPIWPQINMATNGNGIIVGNENVSSGNDHVRYAIWAQPSGPIGAWTTVWSETSGTTSNARWGSCTGTNGYVAVVVDPVSETNVMGTNAIYSFVSTDNGVSFGAQQTEWTPYVDGQDTVVAFFGLDLRCKPGTADRYLAINTDVGTYKSAKLWCIKNGGTPHLIADSNKVGNLNTTYMYQTFAGLIGIDHPSLGWSADGSVMYCVYSVVMNDTGIHGWNTRDIFYSYSTDDGVTWSNAVRVTSTPLIDEGYPSVSLVNPGTSPATYELHMVYMKDPGDGPTAFNGTSTTAPASRNYLIYRKVTQPTVGVTNISTVVPTQYTLDQNYPNPFNPSTTIRFALPKASNVTLKVYNMNGQEVSTLVNNTMVQAGTSEYRFDASKLSSGVYFYTLTAGNFKDTKKMILIK